MSLYAIEERYEIAKRFVLNKTYEIYFKEKSLKYDLCIFGAGALGKEMINWLQNANIEVRYISDNNPKLWGSRISGIPIISPAELCKIEYKSYVIVAVSDGSVLNNEFINVQLAAFRNVFRNPLGVSIYWCQTFDLDSEYVTNSFYKAYNSFEDEYSKKLYMTLWDYRMQNTIIDYPQAEMHDLFNEYQYVARDIVDYDKMNIIIDIGAYTGDTVEFFLDNGVLAHYYCFEMDKNIFKVLKENVDSFKRKYNVQIDTYNLGISSGSYEALYDSKGYGASSIKEKGDDFVQVVSLDDFIKQNKINKIDLLKMDIEGEEENALKGALKTIVEDKPILEISIYHNFSQYINIPLMIKKINANYKLYLRHHKTTLDDTVLYAVIE